MARENGSTAVIRNGPRRIASCAGRFLCERFQRSKLQLPALDSDKTNCRSPVNINDGDEVVVAGPMSGEGLQCYAYRNFSNGTCGDSQGNLAFISGLIATILGGVSFLSLGGLALFAVVPGVFIMRAGWRVKQAKSLCLRGSK